MSSYFLATIYKANKNTKYHGESPQKKDSRSSSAKTAYVRATRNNI